MLPMYIVFDVIGMPNNENDVYKVFEAETPVSVTGSTNCNDKRIWWEYESSRTISSDDAHDHLAWLFEVMLKPKSGIECLIRNNVYIKVGIVTNPVKQDITNYTIDSLQLKVLSDLGLNLNITQFFD